MWSTYANRQIYLDANIIIYAIEENHSWAQSTRSLLDAIDRKLLRAATSELALAEVLVRPLALADDDLVRKYERLLPSDSDVEMISVDRDVLLSAARLQGELKLKLFDAVHVASARLAGCDYFLTQDERLGRALAGEPEWLQLSESM